MATYWLRQDQIEKLRDFKKRGFPITFQLKEAIRFSEKSADVAEKKSNKKDKKNCHIGDKNQKSEKLVRFSIDKKYAISSARLRFALDAWFNDVSVYGKRDYSAEIARLDKEIEGLWQLAINDQNRRNMQVIGKEVGNYAE